MHLRVNSSERQKEEKGKEESEYKPARTGI
jgi:hypothetical protein